MKILAYAEPVIYYARVGAEFLKTVAVNQKIGIPDVGKGIAGLNYFYAALRNGEWKKVTLRQAGQLTTEGIKVGGFLLVGEMIGMLGDRSILSSV